MVGSESVSSQSTWRSYPSSPQGLRNPKFEDSGATIYRYVGSFLWLSSHNKTTSGLY